MDKTHSSPFVDKFDNLAAAAFFNIAIKREATQSPSCPQWFDSVPCDVRYPIAKLRIPDIIGILQAKELSDKIKSRGNEYYKRGDHWEALWKYEHALYISRTFPELKDDAAALHSNIAAVCLKFGQEERLDLLDKTRFPPSSALWFIFTQQHASEAINFNPPPHIQCKAYFRRGESFKQLLKMPELQQSIETMCRFMPFGADSAQDDSYIQVICDFLNCVERQEFPDPKIFCEIIMLSVDHGHLRLLPPLLEFHVRNHLPTLILQEMLKQVDIQIDHLRYFILKHEIQSNYEPHFDGSKIRLETLLKGNLCDVAVFEKLYHSGMRIGEENFALAKQLFQKRAIDKKVYDFILSKQRNSPQEQFFKLKHEGNNLFSRGSYEQALGLYYKALNYCRKHKIASEEVAVIRANCAQACLKLQQYRDAYSHADQCLMLNPESHKGYFRRAEALKAMLESPQRPRRPPGTYETVVKDYLQSHTLKANVETFCTAVLLTIDKELSLSLIPKLTPSDVCTGFSDKVLLFILTLDDITDLHLDFILFRWPHDVAKPFNTVQVKALEVAKRSRSPRVFDFLFAHGMRCSDSLIPPIVHLLTDDSMEALGIVLKYVTSKCSPTLQASLDQGYVQAIGDKKYNLVIILIEFGAEPDWNELKSIKELRTHPFIMKHLNKETLVTVNTDGQDCRTAMAMLNKEARKHFKANHYPQAIQLYLQALDVCNNEHNFSHEHDFSYDPDLFESKVATLANLSLAYIKDKSYKDAFKVATECLNLNPDHAKAYFRRAEALRKLLDSSVGRKMMPQEVLNQYGRVVDDICKGNLIEMNPKAFADAIVVAVDYDEQARLFYSNSPKVPESFFNNVLSELVSRSDCKPKHLHFLLCTMWSLKEFSAAGVSLKCVLSEIGVTDLSTVQRLVELGMVVKEEDVSTAVDVMKTDNSKHLLLFKYIVSKCPPKALDTLCTKSYKAKKFSFVFSFIEHGAQSPDAGTELLEYALKIEDYIVGMDLVRTMPVKTLKKIDLSEIMDTNLIKAPKILKLLIECGASPNGLGRKSPLVSVLSMDHLPIEKRCEVACLLLNSGADCSHLCRMKRGATTPLHVATELSLQAGGNTSLITAVHQSPTFNSKKLINDKQETPLHLTAKSHYKKEPNLAVLKALIELGIINPAKKDKSGKRPLDYLSKKDARAKLLEAAAKSFKQGGPGKTKKKSNKEIPFNKPLEPEPPKDTPPEKPSPVVAPKEPEFNYDKLKLQEKLDWQVSRLLKKDEDYFTTSVSEEVTDEAVKKPRTRHPSIKVSPCKNEPERNENIPLTMKQLSPIASEDPQSPQDISSIFAELGFDLDNLPWEVEGTDRVVKFFKDVKRNSEIDRVCAARTIFYLAEGKRNKHLATPVSSHKDEGPSLYEARLTRAARLLWEKAITFSSKLTGHSSTPVYTQVIRIWEIVLDHDALERRIKACTEQVLLSYNRGRDAAVKWTLKPEDKSLLSSGGVRGREMIEVPKRFLLHGTHLQNADYEFIPAASTNKDEYNVTTFVSFDTVTFKSMLLGTNERRDYPFKEWQKEHEIIKLYSKEAILLLGRSGTGKTTCCLYRLWNEFKAFWNPQSPTHNYKLPRRVLVTPVIIQEESDESDSVDTDTDSDSEEEAPQQVLHRQDSTKSGGSGGIEEFVRVPSRQTSSEFNSQSSQGEIPTIAEQTEEIPDDTDNTPAMELVEEDLHQVFVTKNYVLCDQIKKRFFNMVAAHEFLDEHLEFENSNLPNSFSNFDNLSFPIFLTARQFYILLDNSLGDDETFFRRDSEGNLTVKIISMDYDHEDAEILLDLEESDSEGEEDAQVSPETQRADTHVAKQHAEKWTEVTALFFKEIVWPTISHQCQVSSKDFDPLLVWVEIQSFIKGSERALRKGAPLDYYEYFKLGNKLAPNFSNSRETIYQLFQKYQIYLQKLRHSEFLFDECDLMHNLYKRLQKVTDVSWSFHSMYIDEVQDFTQAELAILIHCCRDPNSMLFTGDTAQSIMRGIAFRFQDLRSLYHQIHQHTSIVKVPQKPFSLTINFRSHSGILKLAGSVIDLIREFFKNSIDHLPDDEGMFPGPIPVLVESCKVDELALLLSTNKRKASAIEFGAHQAIIVQSKESKDRLPDILKGAIVLTIFEAKGLEFDDVLLYNFFTDSLVDEKGWRVVSSYLEMSRHEEKIVNSSKLPGSSGDPRSRPFDPKLHKSLNAELKYLYTAITRTKCNLWIYDSDSKMRLPMFDYWFKRNLVKVVGAGSVSEVEGMYNLVFASNSTPEQWKAQGDNFRKKHLWDQARLCYERAGEENKYLVKEAQAYQLIQSARKQKLSLYLDAAMLFLECDNLHHKTHYINAAALCLRHARPLKLSQAGLLYEKLGEHSKACQVYLKAKDLDNFTRIKEAKHEYSSVVRTLLGRPFMRKRDALMKAREYEELGVLLEPELSASKLSYSCAKFYAERKDKETLVDVLQYMPEVDRKVRFLKEAKLYDKAFKEYKRNKRYSEAYRLAAAQGWFHEGQVLAQSVRNHSEQDGFILKRAKSKYKQLLAKEGKLSNEQVIEEVGQDIINDLYYLKDKAKRAKDVSAYAALLLGMILTDKGLCRLAWRSFRNLKHKIGELEAFHQLQQVADESNQSVLEVCRLAREVSKTFQNTKDIHPVIQQGLKFYALQKAGQVYYTARDQDIWIPDILAKCQTQIEKYDIDGMHRLDPKKVQECISLHCNEYLKRWVERFHLDTVLPFNCDSFVLHKQLKQLRDGLDREYSPEEVSSESLRRYIQSFMEYLDLRLILNKDSDGLISHLLVLFSPKVTRYLPQQFNEHHVATLRRFIHTHPAFKNWVTKSVLTPSKTYPERIALDSWLNSWRVCCLTSSDTKLLSTTLRELEDNVTKRSHEANFEPPSGFVFHSTDSVYYHVFSMWLHSCTEIRDNGNALWASKLAIYHFISEIAISQFLSITVVNMVDILSLYSTALLAILTHVQARQNRRSILAVPMLYRSTVQLFDIMITTKDSKWKVLQACAHKVNSTSDKALQQCFYNSRALLIRSLDILLGTFKPAPWFSVLKFALKNRLHSDDTRHCLILTLTLFGNLITLHSQQDSRIIDYHQKMIHIFGRIFEKQEALPEYVVHVFDTIRKPGFVHPQQVFILVETLLQMKNGKALLARLELKQAGKHSKVEFIPFHSQPPRMRLPPRLQQQQNQFPVSAKPVSPLAPQTLPAPQPPVSTPAVSTLPVYHPGTFPWGNPQPQLQHAMYPQQGMRFPVQPLQGDPNMFFYNQGAQGIPPPAQNPGGYTPAYPMETAVREPSSTTGHPQQPISTLQSIPPSFIAAAPNTSSSTVSEDSGFSSEGATTEGAGKANAVGAHVVASYSINELRRLASTNQASMEPSSNSGFDNFEFSYDLGPDGSQDGDYDETDQEYEEGGFEKTLGDHFSQEPDPPPVDPDLVDPSIVTSEYCSACGESFVDPESNEDTEENIIAKALKLHYAHVTSKSHSVNAFLCKKFFSVADSEESDRSYRILTQKLQDLVIHCEDLKKIMVDKENLDKLIDSIKENEEKNEKLLTDIQERRAWREGIQILEDIVNEMDRLLYRGEGLYKQWTAELQTPSPKDPARGEELDEGDLKMLSGSYEDEPVAVKESEWTEIKQMRSVAEKQVSRQRKRERRERQGRGGGTGGNRRK